MVYDATPLYGEKSKYLNKLAVTFKIYNESLHTTKRKDLSYKTFFNIYCSQQ